MSSEWLVNQQNRVKFVMVDSSRNELSGLTLAIQVSKDNGAFAAAGGTWGETSGGWYWYLSSAAEADTVGPIGLLVTAPGAIQQNLEYVVVQRTSGFKFWPYQVTYLGNPVSGVTVWVTPDLAGEDPAIWVGTTDATGYAYDEKDNPPLLPLGNNYFWKWKAGWRDLDNPDLEVVT